MWVKQKIKVKNKSPGKVQEFYRTTEGLGYTKDLLTVDNF